MPLPEFEIQVYQNADVIPPEAERIFASELADSRRELPDDRADRGRWRFALILAVSGEGRILGGCHIDAGPINYGPAADDLLAFIEGVLVLEPYRRNGLGKLLIDAAVRQAQAMGYSYLRCSADWNNIAEVALYRCCGFALLHLNSENEYLAVKSLQPNP